MGFYGLLIGVWLIPSFFIELGIHLSLGLSMGINKAMNSPSYLSKQIDTKKFREMVFNSENFN